ncbi:MAG: FMN-binding protein [Moraxellaceae bacterium]|nr:FMN-binding protein [Moraxellaceae bacterium]
MMNTLIRPLLPVLMMPVLIMFCAPVQAVEYLSVRAAQAVLFPEATRFVSRPLKLERKQLDQILEQAQSSMRTNRWKLWEARQGDALLGFVMTDAVIGKHELFGYAVAFDRQGVVRRVRIMSYLETQGGEVREPAWLRQFEGRHAGSALQLGKGIDNISGATLSCRHLTEGIRRLAFYARNHLAVPAAQPVAPSSITVSAAVSVLP